MKVERYKIYTSNGKAIRVATQVVLENGQKIKFMERISKKQAISQVKSIINRPIVSVFE